MTAPPAPPLAVELPSGMKLFPGHFIYARWYTIGTPPALRIGTSDGDHFELTGPDARALSDYLDSRTVRIGG